MNESEEVEWKSLILFSENNRLGGGKLGLDGCHPILKTQKAKGEEIRGN